MCNWVDFPWFSRDPDGDGVQNPKTSVFVCKVADESRASQAEVGLLALEAAGDTCLDSVFILLWQVPATAADSSIAVEVMSVLALGKPAPDAICVKETKTIDVYLKRKNKKHNNTKRFKIHSVITPYI